MAKFEAYMRNGSVVHFEAETVDMSPLTSMINSWTHGDSKRRLEFLLSNEVVALVEVVSDGEEDSDATER